MQLSDSRASLERERVTLMAVREELAVARASSTATSASELALITERIRTELRAVIEAEFVQARAEQDEKVRRETRAVTEEEISDAIRKKQQIIFEERFTAWKFEHFNQMQQKMGLAEEAQENNGGYQSEQKMRDSLGDLEKRKLSSRTPASGK